MNIVVVYGQRHKGNTYKLTQKFLEHFKNDGSEILEFFLPDNSLSFCVGCLNCVTNTEKECPHYDYMGKMTTAIDAADLLVFTSPCYVFNMTGQLKTLFDHYGYRFMAHRPEKTMFKKQAIAISTAAGAGMNKTAKLIAFNFFMWGVAKIYKYGVQISAFDFDAIPDKRKKRISDKVAKIAKKVIKRDGKVKPNLKTRFMFQIMKMNQKRNNWSITDKEHWQQEGWLTGSKPF